MPIEDSYLSVVSTTFCILLLVVLIVGCSFFNQLIDMAPEVLFASSGRARFNESADIFSLGCVLFFMYFGRPAFQSLGWYTLFSASSCFHSFPTSYGESKKKLATFPERLP